ncbi:hypothetical protein [Deinococcus petrolearius]|uniref:Uncharacterized protein n=1 Tax=Deinococcus petrolearius TaxID=1751295 RepID=A0ABW1DIH9_9DEIO
MPPLPLALADLAQADPDAPPTFRLTPAEYPAYRSDPPPPLTLTLHLGNPSARAVPLTCRSLGAPVLRAWLASRGGVPVSGVPVNRAADLRAFVPVGNAPTCRAVGQRLRLPPGAADTYTRALGTPHAGAQTEYSAGLEREPAPRLGLAEPGQHLGAGRGRAAAGGDPPARGVSGRPAGQPGLVA